MKIMQMDLEQGLCGYGYRNEKGDRFENGAESDLFNVCASTESMNLLRCMF